MRNVKGKGTSLREVHISASFSKKNLLSIIPQVLFSQLIFCWPDMSWKSSGNGMFSSKSLSLKLSKNITRQIVSSIV
jgi:hypothetical protein